MSMRWLITLTLFALVCLAWCLPSDTKTPAVTVSPSPINIAPVPLSFTTDEIANAETNRVFAWAFLMLVTVLIITLISGYTIASLHCEYVSEAAGAITIGFLIGIFVKYIGGFERFTQLVAFNQEFFFLVLLPPIIFESGYNMQKVRVSHSMKK